ncbi:MAG: carboxypeptidase regulatory-like domain-containing protein [Deltaproteobacteria bacterium]|nr:carboxypeptidase regulatory-like domain-containing protein [Deltaproteobacteria bacterium]
MTTLRGSVRDSQGNPIAGVPLELRAQGWRGQVWRAVSGRDGVAVFQLPPMNPRSAGVLTLSAPSVGVSERVELLRPFSIVASNPAATRTARTLPTQGPLAPQDRRLDDLIALANRVGLDQRLIEQLRSSWFGVSEGVRSAGLSWLANELAAGGRPGGVR